MFPDWKGYLQEALTNYVQLPLESKANLIHKDLETKFQEFKTNHQQFQHTLILIALASFLVLTITLTWPNEPTNQTQ